MEQAKIAEEAEERGIKKKTLWNAKKELQIDSVKIGNKWFLDVARRVKEDGKITIS